MLDVVYSGRELMAAVISVVLTGRELVKQITRKLYQGNIRSRGQGRVEFFSRCVCLA